MSLHVARRFNHKGLRQLQISKCPTHVEITLVLSPLHNILHGVGVCAGMRL